MKKRKKKKNQPFHEVKWLTTNCTALKSCVESVGYLLKSTKEDEAITKCLALTELVGF